METKTFSIQQHVSSQLMYDLVYWLQCDGVAFFLMVFEEYGTISDAVWMEGEPDKFQLPHPVHFREGMQVRNWIRQHPDWPGEDKFGINLDDYYEEILRKAIETFVPKEESNGSEV